jgi:hypothetical protein
MMVLAMMSIGGARKCLQLVCAALVSCTASQLCSAATLISLNHILWPGGTPCTDVSVMPSHVLKADLSTGDMSALSSHDLVLIIDKSHSMSKVDCLALPLDSPTESSNPSNASNSPVSRWQWCHQQTLDFSAKTKDTIPAGFTVVLFSNNCVVYNNVDAKAIETVFSQYTPKGATNLAAALKTQLDQYFERRLRLGQGVRPLLVAVITDGCPDDLSKLCYVLIDATHKMSTRDEISFTFLQVGNDSEASKLLKELDNGLVSHKAKFDIVNVVPFTEMRRMGLASALTKALVKK